MHIPNGFLTDPVCTVSTLAATAAVGVGLMRVRQLANPSNAWRSSAAMAATGAGIFAAQMINFPIAAGTSGHMLGAALAAIVLGPWRGMLTMAVVLATQCFLFGDGGSSTLGANILNMAVAGTLVASGLNTFVTRHVAGTQGKLLGSAVAGLGSVLAAASLCAAELAASGTHGLAEVFSAMLSVHAVIGLSEALLTAALVAVLAAAVRRDALSARHVAIGGLALAVAVSGLIAPWASSAPDGLERVAQELNIATLAAPSWALVSDDAFSLATWPALAVSLAGIFGVLSVFLSAYAVDRAVKVRVRK